MEPWQSWGLALVLGGAAALYYGGDTRLAKSLKERLAAPVEQPHAQAAQRKPSRAGSRGDTDLRSGPRGKAGDTKSEPAREHKPAKASKSKASGVAVAQAPKAPTARVADVAEADDVAEDADNKEWARRLDAAQKGVSLQQQSNTSKAKKASQAAGRTSASGLNEQSPAVVKGGRTTGNGEVSSKDVSGVADMLDAPAPAPSVMRIVGEDKPKKPSAAKPAPEQETKKQRQNKKKAEEARLQREADEQERKVLAEQQRRVARESRGEPAKNGIPVASAPASNAWSAPRPATNGTSATPTSVDSGGLLDTFDRGAAASTNGVDVPSEEAQMALLSAMSDDASWNEVPGKGKKGKKKSAATASPVLSTEDANHTARETPAAAAPLPPPAATQKPAPAKKALKAQSNGFAILDAEIGHNPGEKGHKDDSDWAVF